jgi:Extracellular link domain
MNSTVQKFNSLVPMASNVISSNAKSLNKAATSAYNSVNNAVNSGLGSLGLAPAANVGSAIAANAANAGNAGGSFGSPLTWFVGFLLLFLVLFAFFYQPFMNSVQNWTESIQQYFNPNAPPAPTSDIKHNNDTAPSSPPMPPQDASSIPPSGFDAVVEKVIPPAKEVFSVSSNNFSYYDAAPLCKALGAELATYDQVKAAWQKGADWCNYGWVKGQMAVYPTQQDTYDKLQQGPADERGACGKPGINGGYFDNPELKYGVTCIGPKPSQSAHDATTITSGATRPLTSQGLKFENKVQQFKEHADTMGILPFNGGKWTGS